MSAPKDLPSLQLVPRRAGSSQDVGMYGMRKEDSDTLAPSIARGRARIGGNTKGPSVSQSLRAVRPS